MTESDASADALRQVERERLAALIAKDVGRAGPMHADDYQLVTPGGGTISKDDYLRGVASGELNYVAFEPVSAMAVRFWGGAAAIRYRVHIQMRSGGQVDADEFWHTDIYESRDGHWQAVWSQATRIRR